MTCLLCFVTLSLSLSLPLYNLFYPFSFAFLSLIVADVVTPLSGRGPIYSSYFSCRYSDTSLLGCRHSNSTYGNYDHSYDAGVKCYANGKYTIRLDHPFVMMFNG